jgi:hypothetical protein
MWPESAGFQTHAEKPGVPTVMLRVSVLQQFTLFNKLLSKSVANDLHALPFSVAHTQHRPCVNPYFRPAHALPLIFELKHEQTRL